MTNIGTALYTLLLQLWSPFTLNIKPWGGEKKNNNVDAENKNNKQQY